MTGDPVIHSQEPGCKGKPHCFLLRTASSTQLHSDFQFEVCVCVCVCDSTRSGFRGIGDMTETKIVQRLKYSQP